MPTKPKPAAVRRVWTRHPWWSMGTVAAVVGTVVAVAPFVSSFLGRYQTVEAAHREVADVRRQVAWIAVNQARQAATVARNRLNDCDIAKAKQGQTPLERAACAQYQQDMDAANTAYNDAVRLAKELSK